MIEELKFLLDQLETVPETALYVLGGFALFKLVVYLSGTGSVVYVIKLIVEKLHSAYVTPRPPKLVDMSGDVKCRVITVDDTYDLMCEVLNSVCGKGTGIKSQYIHRSSALWLKQAILEKEQRDAEES